jgi:hypothetical protein
MARAFYLFKTFVSMQIVSSVFATVSETPNHNVFRLGLTLIVAAIEV